MAPKSAMPSSKFQLLLCLDSALLLGGKRLIEGLGHCLSVYVLSRPSARGRKVRARAVRTEAPFSLRSSSKPPPNGTCLSRPGARSDCVPLSTQWHRRSWAAAPVWFDIPVSSRSTSADSSSRSYWLKASGGSTARDPPLAASMLARWQVQYRA